MMRYQLAFALVAVGLAWPNVVRSEDQPLEVQIVDALNKAFGAHSGFRANHAKGIVVEGNFKASSEAPLLSKAKLFDGSTIPVTAIFRFNRYPEPARRVRSRQSARNGDQVSSARR